MPKRRRFSPEALAIRERIVRQVKARLFLHWEMLASYCERPDPELKLRLLNNRATIIEAMEQLLPTPSVPLALEDEAEHPPPSVH